MKRCLLVQAVIVFLWLTFSDAVAFAQDALATQPGKAPAQVRVYLAGFSGSAVPAYGVGADLKSFLNDYLYLRFSQIRNVSVASEPPDTSCGTEQNSVRRSVQKQLLASQASDSLSFYTVSGSIETHPRDPSAEAGEVVINYELVKTVRCAPQVLLRRIEPVPQARFLDSISVMADALAYRVGEDAAKRVNVNVRTVLAEKVNSDDAEFAAALIDYLVQALATTDDLRPVDSSKNNSNAAAEYALEAHVTFPRSANPLRGFSRSVEVSLYVVASGQTLPESAGSQLEPLRYTLTPNPIRGSTGQRSQIFAAAADAAVRGVDHVRYAREVGLPENHSTAEAVQKAKQLLCADSSQGSCVPQTDTAISLLKKEPPNATALEWLGRAQYISGRYADAAQSYSALLNSAQSLTLEDALRLNLASGDAWYRAQGFTNASVYFDAAAKLITENAGLRSETDFNLQRSLSRRFTGDNIGAIDVLLDPVGTVADPGSLEHELEQIVATLSPNELSEAIARLKRNGTTRSHGGALLLAYQNLASFQIDNQHYAEAEATIRTALTLHDEKSVPYLSYLFALSEFLELRSQFSPGQRTTEYRAISDRLDPILKEDPTAFSYGPLTIQLLLCTDYLEDRPCIQRTINYLDFSKKEPPPEIELDLVEIQILDKDYDAATGGLNRIFRLKDLEPRLRTVACFYQIWIALADGKYSRAEEWFRKWQDALKNTRKSGTPLLWMFAAARRVLQSETDPSPVGNKDLILAMIRAMEDNKAQVPAFHQ